MQRRSILKMIVAAVAAPLGLLKLKSGNVVQVSREVAEAAPVSVPATAAAGPTIWRHHYMTLPRRIKVKSADNFLIGDWVAVDDNMCAIRGFKGDSGNKRIIGIASEGCKAGDDVIVCLF